MYVMVIRSERACLVPWDMKNVGIIPYRFVDVVRNALAS